MAARRNNQVVIVVALVAALIAVWVSQRGQSTPSAQPPIAAPPIANPAPAPIANPAPTPRPPIANPAPTPRPPIANPAPAPRPPIASPAAPAAADLELSSIADADERAAVAAVAAAIDRGGPFAYRRDGVVFENREGRLPSRPRGYWHEYTVPTPGEDDRGARRLVAGAAAELFYSRDHYRSFRRIRAGTAPR